MKIQHSLVVTLAILSAAGVALSQQSPAATPSTGESSSRSPRDDVVTKIVALQYYPANELSILLATLAHGQATIIPDQRSNQLVITAPQGRLDELLEVISRLDVADQTAQQQAQYLTCRVYMLELPSKDQNLKSFSVLLERQSDFPTSELMDAAKGVNVQIVTLSQRHQDDRWALALEGRAATNEALQQMLAKITSSHIKELRWVDETFTAAIPAAQISRLPASLQEHIHKLLGDEVQTIGYWFGNLSVPGDLNAPIGPWQLNMKIQPGQGADLVLEVRVTRESPFPFVNESQLFSNTVQSKAGRPIIIGYNRDAYGTRVMGAMVILLEPDTTAPATDEAKPK